MTILFAVCSDSYWFGSRAHGKFEATNFPLQVGCLFFSVIKGVRPQHIFN